jgi:hypothetical protein
VIWNKPNPMPESVRDRPTRSHEYVFLLSKSARYRYHAAAIRTPQRDSSVARSGRGRDVDVPAAPGQTRQNGKAFKAGPGTAVPTGWDTGKGAHGTILSDSRRESRRGHERRHEGFGDRWDSMPRTEQLANGANARSVWTIPSTGFADAHFATFPVELADRCIRAGSGEGDVVLDPFGGSGTVGLVAQRLSRHAVLIELKPQYVQMALKRIRGDAPLYSEVTVE